MIIRATTVQPGVAFPAEGKALSARDSVVSVARAFLLLTLLVGTGFLSTGSLAANDQESASLPGFLFEPLFASNQGWVHGVFEGRHADLVLLVGGLDSGLRTGMVCRVTADGEEIGELMLVEVRKKHAAGLILQLESGQVIEPGQSVRIKTVKF